MNDSTWMKLVVNLGTVFAGDFVVTGEQFRGGEMCEARHHRTLLTPTLVPTHTHTGRKNTLQSSNFHTNGKPQPNGEAGGYFLQ